MDRTSGNLVVFFEAPYWIGVFERIWDGKLSVCKVTFGAEPKDYEIDNFILNHYKSLKFSLTVDANEKKTAANPKRRQREAGKWIQSSGVGTRSQQALKLQHEEQKIVRKQINKAMLEEKERRLFDLKQKKRKEKHRGH